MNHPSWLFLLSSLLLLRLSGHASLFVLFFGSSREARTTVLLRLRRWKIKRKEETPVFPVLVLFILLLVLSRERARGARDRSCLSRCVFFRPRKGQGRGRRDRWCSVSCHCCTLRSPSSPQVFETIRYFVTSKRYLLCTDLLKIDNAVLLVCQSGTQPQSFLFPSTNPHDNIHTLIVHAPRSSQAGLSTCPVLSFSSESPVLSVSFYCSSSSSSSSFCQSLPSRRVCLQSRHGQARGGTPCPCTPLLRAPPPPPGSSSSLALPHTRGADPKLLLLLRPPRVMIVIVM